eukprot:scaffold15285_cov78-Skeletonema_dohrnii-CCMP3373.AAC.2
MEMRDCHVFHVRCIVGGIQHEADVHKGKKLRAFVELECGEDVVLAQEPLVYLPADTDSKQLCTSDILDAFALSTKVERHYRIPLPDWAAVLIAVPPCLATIAIILISNLELVGDIAKRKGWFEYEVKTRGYAMPPMDDSSSGVETFDPLSSDVVNHEGEWGRRIKSSKALKLNAQAQDIFQDSAVAESEGKDEVAEAAAIKMKKGKGKGGYEIWGADQSNSVSGESSAGVKGSFL